MQPKALNDVDSLKSQFMLSYFNCLGFFSFKLKEDIFQLNYKKNHFSLHQLCGLKFNISIRCLGEINISPLTNNMEKIFFVILLSLKINTKEKTKDSLRRSENVHLSKDDIFSRISNLTKLAPLIPRDFLERKADNTKN